MSQWSTLESGPLAGMESMEKGRNRGKSREPVDHSFEWTTSSVGKAGKESSPKSCVKICRLSYSLFAFGEIDKEGARIGLPSIV